METAIIHLGSVGLCHPGSSDVQVEISITYWLFTYLRMCSRAFPSTLVSVSQITPAIFLSVWRLQPSHLGWFWPPHYHTRVFREVRKVYFEVGTSHGTPDGCSANLWNDSNIEAWKCKQWEIWDFNKIIKHICIGNRDFILWNGRS